MICFKFGNTSPVIFGSLTMASVKDMANAYNDRFLEAWEKGIRSFWAGGTMSAQCVLGMLLARLGEDVDQAELMCDMMTSEARTIFDHLTYVNDARDRLNVGAIDYMMIDLPGGSPRHTWAPFNQLGRELFKRKISMGCGAIASNGHQVPKLVRHRFKGDIKRIALNASALSVAETQGAVFQLRKDAIVMVDPKTGHDLIAKLFTAGVTICVDFLRHADFAREIVEGYQVVSSDDKTS